MGSLRSDIFFVDRWIVTSQAEFEYTLTRKEFMMMCHCIHEVIAMNYAYDFSVDHMIFKGLLN